MDYFRRFTFLFAAPVFDTDDLEGLRFNQIITEIERSGFEVVRARKLEDAEIAVQTDAAIGCMVVDWGKKGLEGKTASLINLMRKRGLEMPIMILVRRKRFEDIPVEVLDFIDGYVFLAEETPEFIAKNLVSRLKQYAETLKTPFFGELVDYSEEGNQLWTCPGHNGGIFYSRSPIGRIFVEHLGEAIFRDDLDNSVLELGDLLTHEGPALAAQKEAAAIFGAEKTYFVLNGTSSSNKIVLTNLIAEDDLVLFDRNNHKAAHHGALLIGGGVPIYLSTDRNAYGLIGPIRPDALDEKAIRERIRTHPLVKDREEWTRELSRFEIDLFRNGAHVDHGAAANVLDGPLFALRHLAETLAPDPESPPLAAGEIVTTGTLTRAFPVAAGEEWSTKLTDIPLEGARIRFV